MSKRALCVGINAYGSGNDLYGCVNDARDWQSNLAARGFTCAMLLDKDATRANLITGIRDLIRGASSGDLCVLTYSGHGSWVPDQDGDEPDGRDEVICPVDIFEGDRWIADDQLHEEFSARHRGVRLVFVSDSCHSGTVSRFADFGQPAPALVPVEVVREVPRVRFLPPETFTAEPEPSPISTPRATRSIASACVLMAGCQDWEYSYDAYFAGRPNGAYTRAALDSLATLPRTASYKDWQVVIRTRLPTREYPQAPALQGARYQKLWQALEEGR